MAHGLYLYCLREARGPDSRIPSAPDGIKAASVDGKSRVAVLAFAGVEAVVSEVNLDDFEEFRKKAREDIEWIKEKAVAHAIVVETAMGKNDPLSFSGSPAVIPVKFGVVFNNAERLLETLNARKGFINRMFERIRAKQEWSVKLFLRDLRKFQDDLQEQNAKLREKKTELDAMPSGMAYLMEAGFKRELDQACARALDGIAGQAFEQLEPFACEAALVKILDGKLTGRSERMVLNSAYLVAANGRREFQGAVATMRENLAQQGFLVEQSGPWPAYHFTEFGSEGT